MTFIVGQTAWFWRPTRHTIIECVLTKYDEVLDRWEADEIINGEVQRGHWVGVRTDSLFSSRADAQRDEVLRLLAGESVVGWRGLL